MKEFWNFIQMVFMAVGGWLGWFMGGCDGLLYALIAFVVIDYLTGVMISGMDFLCLNTRDMKTMMIISAMVRIVYD